MKTKSAVHSAMLSSLFVLAAAQSASAQMTPSYIDSRAVSAASLTSSKSALDRLGPEVSDLVHYYRQIRPSVVAGDELPRWDDFEAIARVRRIAEKISALYKAGARAESFKAEIPRLRDELLNDPVIIAIYRAAQKFQPVPSAKPVDKFEMAKIIRTQTAGGTTTEFVTPESSPDSSGDSKDVVAAKVYKPTEYELSLAYQYQLNEVNRMLPKELRMPIRRVRYDQRRKKIQEDAKLAMATIHESYKQREATMMYGSSYEDFVRQVRSSSSPMIQKALEVIDKDQLEIVIHRPENARFWVPKVGFHNQFVTASSRGSYNPDFRWRVESSCYAFDSVDAYKKLDLEAMPKYGTIRAKRESGLQTSSPASAYGPDIWALKMETIKDRLTYTLSDSFIVSDRRSYGGHKNWDETFIPWKYNLLIAPYLENTLPMGFIDRPRAGSSLIRSSIYSYLSYFEAQIVGSVTLKNIAYFEFGGTPPSGQFLIDLMKAGIPIRDGRVKPSLDWKPSAEDLKRAQESR